MTMENSGAPKPASGEDRITIVNFLSGIFRKMEELSNGRRKTNVLAFVHPAATNKSGALLQRCCFNET